jgi:hypothetical protein
MRKAMVFVTIVFAMFLVSSSVFAYDFLSDDSNIGLNILKEKYIDSLDLDDEEYYDHGFVWAVIAPENYGKEIQEYEEEIEGHIYTITEIIIIDPQGPIRVTWGPGKEFSPYDVPKIVIKHL